MTPRALDCEPGLHTKPLASIDLLVVFLGSTLGYAAVRLDRVLFRRKRPAGPPAVSPCR